MKKIILLNPPSGTVKYSRDYYCSKSLKGSYVEHPLDLLILSGILADECDVSLIDATVMNLSSDATMSAIERIGPEAIIFISGSASWHYDRHFLERVTTTFPTVRMVGIGDILNTPAVIERYPWIDALILDFTARDIVDYIKKRPVKANMIYKDNGHIITKSARMYTGETFSIPLPRHELFLQPAYTFPFARHFPFATVLTDYGCAHDCSFCLYATYGFKVRALEEVYNELRYVRELGVREIFFKDQTFGSQRERLIELCSTMIQNAWGFSWTAFSRVDLVDHEILSLMKRAGCHTIIFGVETANEDILRDYRKGFTLQHVRDAFQLCKKVGIATAATLMIGFPNETRESIDQTLDFAKRIACDYAAFNCYVPKREEAFRSAMMIDAEGEQLSDQSGRAGINGNGVLNSDELKTGLHQSVRAFYLRPAYIIKRLLSIRSYAQLAMCVKNGLSMFCDNL